MKKSKVSNTAKWQRIWQTVKREWKWGLVFLVFIVEIYLRFYKFTLLNAFAWDQVDNAWAAKHILIDHVLPLAGMVVKQNSNVNIGPLYYYYVSIFYFFTRLDPVASGIIAGVTSIISFWILFVITKKLFSFPVALAAILINTFSFRAIFFLDRVQWPVAFIPSFSLLIFFFLYKTIIDSPKYILPLSIMIGLSFHIHFTSIFYPLFVIAALPFFPRKKETIWYGIAGILIAILFLVPSIITFMQSNYFAHAMIYGNSYYHGFHLRRMVQLSGDAFIQFIPYTTDSISQFIPGAIVTIISYLRFILPLLFTYFVLRSGINKKNSILLYLTWVWFIIPWIVFATYKGEISEYYFSVSKFIALFIMSYLLVKLYLQNILTKLFVMCIFLGYVYVNMLLFSKMENPFNLDYHRQKTLNAIGKGIAIPFFGGDPESYLYYEYKLMKWPY